MNVIAKHLIGGVSFIVGIILLIVGLFSDHGSTLVTIGATAAIGGMAFMAYNMYRIFTGSGLASAVSEMTFNAKKKSNRDFGKFGD